MKRSLKDANQSSEQSGDTDVIEGFGFRIERHGRFIFMQTNRTPEQQRYLMTKLKEASKILPEEIKKKAQELGETLSRFNSFDIISQISLANLFINPETYKEPSHEGRPAYPEYVALLCLKRPFSYGEKFLIDGHDIESIQELVDDIFRDTMWLTISKTANLDRDGPPNDFEELQFSIRIHELEVRNPA